MSLLKEEKKQIIDQFKKSELDSGSSEVQIALLTARIKRLTSHFKDHKHDYHGQRGLVAMVNQRRRLLGYLKKKDVSRYQGIIKELGLRK